MIHRPALPGSASRRLLLALLEAVVLFECLRRGLGLAATDPTGLAPTAQAAATAALMLLAAGLLGAYPGRPGLDDGVTVRLPLACALALLASGLLALVPSGPFGLSAPLVASATLAAVAWLVVRWTATRMPLAAAPPRRILVLGNGQEAEDVIRALHRAPGREALDYAGLYPVMPERDPQGRERSLNHDALCRAVDDLRVSEIVVAVRERRGGVLPLRQLLDCRLRGVDVVDLVGFYEREFGLMRVDLLRASGMIFGDGFEQRGARALLKRGVDLAGASALLALATPVWALSALAILLQDRGPVLERETCVGLGGRRFQRLSLRTAARARARAGTVPQVHRVGRWLRRLRLDRLPQLVNVLRGEMSLVGPAPETPDAAAARAEQVAFHAVRQAVRPGITGWARVQVDRDGADGGTVAQLQYDLYYVKHHSLRFDLAILARALRVGRRRKDRR